MFFKYIDGTSGRQVTAKREFSGLGLTYLLDDILAFGFIETGGLLVNMLTRFRLRVTDA